MQKWQEKFSTSLQKLISKGLEGCYNKISTFYCIPPEQLIIAKNMGSGSSGLGGSSRNEYGKSV